MHHNQTEVPISGDAQSWNIGSTEDPVRNNFIIPEIQKLFEKHRPKKILDIGTGTGYVPRRLQEGLTYSAHWTLLDLNSERLEFAKLYKPPSMQMTFVPGDLTALNSTACKFDSALLTFTLLEIENPTAMIEGAIDLLADKGLLVIAMPDGWKDILTASLDDSSLPQRFLTEAIKLPKIDKFTGCSYPFSTMRIETLITTALRHDCVLETLEQGGPQGEVYMLVFCKKQAGNSAQTNA